MNTKIWKCKDGTKVRIKDMTDSHLLNTIRLLQRNSEHQIVQMGRWSDSLRGEEAMYAAEGAIEEAMENGLFPPIYEDLCEEALNRGLDYL